MILDRLKDLEIESIQKGIPIIGSERGEILLKKILELNPEKILELGTANGYSGIILGSNKAEITTIEKNSDLANEAKLNFNLFNIDAKIINGNAIEEIKKFKDNYFDLIFIDFSKKNYIKILDDCIRVVKKNGYIIADNINMDGCLDFKEKILMDKILKTKIINVQSGISFSENL